MLFLTNYKFSLLFINLKTLALFCRKELDKSPETVTIQDIRDEILEITVHKLLELPGGTTIQNYILEHKFVLKFYKRYSNTQLYPSVIV